MTFREKFISSAKAAGVFDALAGAREIAVGFSGGADSTVLLSMIKECFPDAALGAIHVNHMIRGEFAERDEAHCREFCEKLSVPLCVRRVDVPALAGERRIGIEQAAREARYAAFDGYLGSLGEDALLCTAHNADDDLETMIFNLIRGSGTRGMAGIAPRRGRIVRPMLSLSSDEIRAYAAEAALSFVVDETNADTRYTRNLIRGEVIPLLRRVAPECAKSAAAAGALLRRDDDFISALASNAVRARQSVPLDTLRSLDDAVLSRALLEMYTAARGERTDFGSVHVADCISLLRKSARGEICLPGAISMMIADGEATFAPTEREKRPVCFERVILAAGERPRGETFDFPEAGFCVTLDEVENDADPDDRDEKNASGIIIYKKSIYTTLGFGKIKGSITVRERRPGDAILLGGMRRKLKKLICDRKIAARETLPVFCDDDGVLFVPGIGTRDGAASKDGVRISFRRSCDEEKHS